MASPPAKRCVVVPAYKEGENIRPLIERVFKACQSAKMNDVEMIIVDDNSNDGTLEAVQEMSKKGYNARIIVRKTERGLSSAVLKGFQESGAEHLICMDGDLQHPPEKVPELFSALDKGEFVLGTRYGKTFHVDKGWPMHRIIISKGGRLLARPLTPLSDPMSGFFGIRRSALNRGISKVNAKGFKIALELFVKCQCKKHREVEIFFGQRVAGASKLTGKVMLQYVSHLQELYRFQYSYLLLVPILLVLFFLYLFAKLVFRF